MLKQFQHSRERAVLLTLVFILSLLAIFAPKFFELQPLLSRLASAAPKLLVACGVALVIIVRQIDISVGSLFAVCSTLAGLAASDRYPILSPGIVALGVGLLGGAFNGVLVAALRLPSIVVTLATLVTWREGLRLYQQGVFVNLPESVQWFGFSMTLGQLFICSVALGIAMILVWTTNYLSAGRFIYAVGSDPEAARLAGIRPPWIAFLVFTMVGTLTGLAAWLNLVQSPQVDPNSGRGLEMETIAAAIVGGVSVAGGRGRISGVITGLLLLICIGPALTYIGIQPHWEKVIQGTIILLAVVTEGIKRSRSKIANTTA